MKRCPDCRRDYFDDTLLYCLEDGTALVQGAVPSPDEPQTAILHDTDSPAEAETRSFVSTTEQIAILDKGAAAEPNNGSSDSTEKKHGPSANRSAKPLIAAVVAVAVLVGGFFGYRYFSSAATKQIESIAVMPFVNESGNAEIEYLSDGIAETLISSLSQLPDLTVKPRSSVFRYKGKTIDAAAVGKELNVQTVLTGSVVQRGTDIGLHIELVDTTTDRVLWSRNYLRPLSNLIALQSEITREVSSELKTRLSGADERQLAKNSTSNPEAYQLYLRGRFYFGKRTKNDIYKAIEYYQQAVALDPNYALAYSGLADAYLFLPGYDYSVARIEFPAKARENAMKALSLDDSLSEAHISMGLILTSIDHNFDEAERSFRRAIELDPNNADGYGGLAFQMTALGRMDEAEEYYKRALSREPVSLTLNRAYGAFLQIARRHDESVAQLKKTIDLDPGFVLAHLTLANTYQIQGKYSEAVDTYATAREVAGNSRAATHMRESFAKGGWKGFINELTHDRPRYVKAGQLVTIGENEAALDELEKAYEERDSFVTLINVDPRLDARRDEPRFKGLVKKVGL